MTKLYLVRHGETVDNAAQIMQGQTPGKLNAKGIEQAEEVAGKMVNEPIDVFVSSDLYRSIQTCEIIARPHIEALSLTGNLTDEELDAHIVTTPLLRERDWGDFTGKFIPSLPKDPKDWPDNIETLESRSGETICGTGAGTGISSVQRLGWRVGAYDPHF